MTDDLQYKGFLIEPESQPTPEGCWIPPVVVTLDRGNQVRTTPLSSGTGIDFANEAEADAYAVKLAHAWIDRSG
ncbi:MAG: hypothetical protein A3I00_05870 [Betaproteobacteria bacterium RIFCSPLOWO2_02_FULL_64_12]|nr:MAG: hypothetical protein A3I00_05870 [Betaproteobacteria bacterium RIFCSPLOWO2_02_FULL_64_12]OGL17946.1 MAG: hypothetical protein A3F92_14245 [Candidatus Rokubacteria bacterium RIFCSPLOWO2_12_FULL_71_22]